MTTEFRRALPSDLPAILEIVGQAQAFMKSQGLDQWQNGYPQPPVMSADIDAGCCYVLCANGAPAVTSSVFFRSGEAEAHLDAYDVIEDGAWGRTGPYAAVHRVAAHAATRGSGLSRRMMEEVEALCARAGFTCMRIDTHPDNRPMRRHLEKCGFVHRGTIHITGGGGEPGAARVAYDKTF